MNRDIDLSQIINGEYYRDRASRIPVRNPTSFHHTAGPEQESPPLKEQSVEDRTPAEDWEDKYKRLYAELENRKKRQDRLFAGRARQEKEDFIKSFLPLADNLERILEHSEKRENPETKSVLQGIELTLQAFLDALNKHGVQVINPVGQPFDPNLHEAVGIAPNPALPSGSVAYVEQKGYILDGQLLRPAKVLITR